MTRQEKAQKLFEQGHVTLPDCRNPLEAISLGTATATVQSESGETTYIVGGRSCTCPDYHHRGHRYPHFSCAHMRAVDLALVDRPDQDDLDGLEEPWSWESLGFQSQAETVDEIDLDWGWRPTARKRGRPKLAGAGVPIEEDECPTTLSGAILNAWVNGPEDSFIWTATV